MRVPLRQLAVVVNKAGTPNAETSKTAGRGEKRHTLQISSAGLLQYAVWVNGTAEAKQRRLKRQTAGRLPALVQC